MSNALRVRLTRYFLDNDGDGHWFIVPWASRNSWWEWRNLDEDDERAWTPPEFARPLNMHPSFVAFSEPELMDE